MEPPQWSAPSLTAADPPQKGEWGVSRAAADDQPGSDVLSSTLSARSDSGSEASYEAGPRRSSTDSADSRKAKTRYR